jgi:hypothetical protein
MKRFSGDEKENKDYRFFAGGRSSDSYDDFEDFEDEDFSEGEFLSDEDLMNIETIDEENFFKRQKDEQIDDEFLIPEDIANIDIEDIINSDDIGEDIDDDLMEYDR